MDFLLIGRSRFAQRRVLPAAAALPFDSVTVASRREGTHWRTLTGRSPGLVYVSLANGEHAEAVEWALRSGHHVVVDKPAFLTLPEASAAVALARSGVRINSIAPGFVKTPHQMSFVDDPQIKKLHLLEVADPADIAGIAVFLASRAGGFLTGAIIPVDGGLATTASK